MKRPKVSVVMAVYNGERYIEGCIKSVLGQTYRDFEFVIVNDCSTDGTADLIRSFRDPRVVLVENEKNLGQAASLNVGIKHSRGAYIGRIDADDLYYPEKLARQTAYLEGHPEIAVLGTGAVTIDDGGTIRGIMPARLSPWEIEFRMFFESPMIHVSVLMKRDVLAAMNGYDPDYTIAADYHLWKRLLMGGHILANIPDILTAYRVMETTHGVVTGQVTLKQELPKITHSYLTEHLGYPASFTDAENIHRFIRTPEVMGGKTFADTKRLFVDIARHYATLRGVDPALPASIVEGLFLRRSFLRFVKRNKMIRPISKIIRSSGKALERTLNTLQAQAVVKKIRGGTKE